MKCADRLGFHTCFTPAACLTCVVCSLAQVRYTIKAKKEQLNVEYRPDVGALAGWGGEMMLNAKKDTFIHRTMVTPIPTAL